MQCRCNDKLQTVTVKEDLIVGWGQGKGRQINKHETAWWREPDVSQIGWVGNPALALVCHVIL